MNRKRALCLVLAVLMVMAMFTACGNSDDGSAGDDSSSAGDTIKLGIIGCHTGENAVYGLAVRNGAELYVNQLNEAGGINGKQVELVIYDNKGDDTEATTAFTRMVDEGITALIGDVLTGNTIAVVGKAYPLNMPMITASATAEAVTYDEESDTVYSNVFRTCFIDPFQGEKMAEYAAEKMGVKTAAVFYENGNDYSVGLSDAFIAKCAELGIEVVATEAFSTGDKDFKAQLTNIASANPEVIFCPAYYENDGMIVTQAREVGVTGTFLGGDGWDGVSDYASAEDLEGSLYCSAYAPGSSEEVIAFEEAYIAAYGEETLSMFAANAYDAAMVMCNALKIAEEAGLEAGSDEYKQAVIDAIRDDSGDLDGITSDGYTFDEYNNPIKNAVIMELVDGVETYKETF
jgi:branched-chain amino acid transport system substrate-binding protein